MIESSIIALREGIEIALVLGILIVYLRKVNRPALVKTVYIGLAAAVFASIGGAVVLQRLAIDQESLEGFFMLAAAVFVITMIIWMWVEAKRIRNEIEEKVNRIIAAPSEWKAHLGVFGFTFIMIVREGIETAIFLQAVALSAGAWRSLVGTVVGISLASAFAVLFIRGSVRIDVARFLKVTAFTLLIFTLQLILNAVHEFYEYGILPASPKMMGLLGPIVQNDVLFIVAIFSIPAFMLMIPGRRSSEASRDKSQRGWQWGAAIASLCVILLLGGGTIFSSGREMDFTAQTIAIPSDSLIRIPIADVRDGAIHRYAATVDSIEIRFWALRTSFGKYATAFDACRACYSYGKYYLKNGQLICSLCDAPSPMSKLKPTTDESPPDPNNSGSMEGNGCAPIYLPSHIQDANIVIAVRDLQKERRYFDITPETK